MSILRRSIVLLFVCTAACDAPTPRTHDGGIDARVGDSAADDAPGDVPGDADRCVTATLSAWALDSVDDVSIRYRARLTPQIEGQTWDLVLEMNRYLDETHVGTFELGQGPEANFSTCARCVAAFRGMSIAHGFFADEGELLISVDPFSQRLSASLTNVRLIEVTIGGETLESTPVPDGLCVRLEDTTIDRVFPSPGWRCGRDQFADGATCDCSCGAYDPDCEPGNPIVGCGEHEICSTDAVCVETCDRATARGCTSGVCGLGYGTGEICITDASRVDASATIGRTCAAGATFCDAGDGFARGLCDRDHRADGLCRPLCRSNEECDTEALEICAPWADGWGHCALRFPTAWTCDGALYEDGTSCDCRCGTTDPDCHDPALPIADCAAGEVCLDAPCGAEGCALPATECVPPPANDVCASAIPLVGSTSGTTRAAVDDYRFAAGCAAAADGGGDVVYRLDLTAGQHIMVVGTPNDFDLAFYLFGPGDATVCDPSSPSCVLVVDAAGHHEAETLSYTATTAGTYYLVVDSTFSYRAGDFTLDVE